MSGTICLWELTFNWVSATTFSLKLLQVAENLHALSVALLHIWPLQSPTRPASSYPHKHTMQSPTDISVPSAYFLVWKLLGEIVLLYGNLAYYFSSAWMRPCCQANNSWIKSEQNQRIQSFSEWSNHMGKNEAMWTMDKEEDFISIISNLRRNNIQGNQMQSWATVTCFLNISPGHYQLLSNFAGETTTAYILQMILRAADGLACHSKFPFCMASE